MKTIDGKCDDCSCAFRTLDGYCRVTACFKSVPTVTSSTTSGDYIEFLQQTAITDHGMKEYIKLYLKDHSLSDLMQILADIV